MQQLLQYHCAWHTSMVQGSCAAFRNELQACFNCRSGLLPRFNPTVYAPLQHCCFLFSCKTDHSTATAKTAGHACHTHVGARPPRCRLLHCHCYPHPLPQQLPQPSRTRCSSAELSLMS
jgi:hypothetical protein